MRISTPLERRRSAPWVMSARVIGVLFLVGLIVQLNSERAYWFYSTDWWTRNLGEMLGVAAFYGAAAAAALWALGRVSFRGLHQVVLMGAVFAWTVEGVIVYVLHEAGPLDVFFPLMFAGWHGALSFVFFFYLVRRWLLDGRTKALAIGSAVYGALWGAWALVSWLPDSDQATDLFNTGLAPRTDPLEFAATAVLITATLAMTHVLLDRIWPADWRPGALSGSVIVGLTGLWAAGSFFFASWAPARWALLVAVPVLALVASNRGPGGPNLYGSMQGRVEVGSLWALLPIPAIAAAIYAGGWQVEPSIEYLEVIRSLHVLAQVLAGGGTLGWAILRSIRRTRSSEAPVLPSS